MKIEINLQYLAIIPWGFAAMYGAKAFAAGVTAFKPGLVGLAGLTSLITWGVVALSLGALGWLTWFAFRTNT